MPRFSAIRHGGRDRRRSRCRRRSDAIFGRRGASAADRWGGMVDEDRSARGSPLACRKDGTEPGAGWRRPGSLLQTFAGRFLEVLDTYSCRSRQVLSNPSCWEHCSLESENASCVVSEVDPRKARGTALAGQNCRDAGARNAARKKGQPERRRPASLWRSISVRPPQTP